MIQKPDRDCLRWTPGDDQYLLEHAGILKAEVIGRHLRRCVEGVHRRASRLGVSLVCHVCRRGHKMTQSPSGEYRCYVCRNDWKRKNRSKK